MYKVTVIGFLFKKTYKNVIGDGFTPGGLRFLVLDNGERIELPQNLIFIFSTERGVIAEKQAKAEAEKKG